MSLYVTPVLLVFTVYTDELSVSATGFGSSLVSAIGFGSSLVSATGSTTVSS